MKRQKWLTGVLVVMLMTSLLLAVGTFAPIVAAGGGGGIEPEEICSNFDCWPEGGGCQYWGQYGYWETCCYTPFPQMCQYCPSPCCWTQCHWW